MSETGTGKELLARLIHQLSPRAEKSFNARNCAAFNPALLERELFGHEKGSFTGAIHSRKGRFEEADGGTLLLDEIRETSREFQSALLRALQERVIERVGNTKPTPVDVRVIASTNRDIEREVAEGRFREDLYYRLRVVPIRMPPLRERNQDILPIARHFVSLFAAQMNRPRPIFDTDAEADLLHYDWPGNFRELRNGIERAVILKETDILHRADLIMDQPDSSTTGAQHASMSLADHLEQASREHVSRVLTQTEWNRTLAAELLGIDRTTLYRMLRKLNIRE